MQSQIQSRCLPQVAARRRFSILTLLGLARSRRALAQLDETRLFDLGISANQAEAEAKRPFWDIPTLWK